MCIIGNLTAMFLYIPQFYLEFITRMKVKRNGTLLVIYKNTFRLPNDSNTEVNGTPQKIEMYLYIFSIYTTLRTMEVLTVYIFMF